MRCSQCGAAVADPGRPCPRCGADPGEAATRTSRRPTAPLPPAASFSPGSEFAGRFTIIEQVGEGGMGIVFKAIDRSLGQHVALKIIQPDLARARASVERFKDEVRLTRKIAHPNVCRVHDLGEDRGVLYLSMEWIEGETLRRLLRQAGRLEERRALEIAEKIARALQAAHAKGVVHRDLKPENVMVDSGGEVYVMDFGLAKDLGAATTRPTGPVGTPGYMAPEQLRGEKVDARTDLYALGLVLEEMLTGKPPSRSLARGDLRSQVSGRVVPVVEQLLAEDRERRPGSAREVGESLRRILTPGSIARLLARARPWAAENRRSLGIAAVVLVAIVVAWRLLPPSPPPPEVEEFYERGMHYLREEAGTRRNYTDAVNMFHRALQRDPEHAPSWAGLGEAYSALFEQAKEPASLEEAREAVARALELAPSLREARNARARVLIAEGSYQEAKQVLEEILRSEQDWDVAWANLGRADRQLGKRAGALAALRKAIALNPASFQHRITLGNFFNHFEELEEAVKAYRDAIERKPDSPLAWTNLCGTFLKAGRLPEAEGACRDSLAREDNADARSNLGTVLYFLGKYETAEAEYRRATELEPGNYVHWFNLGDALRTLGGDPQARAAYEQAARLGRELTPLIPGDAQVRMTLALSCAYAGDEECAIREGERAAEMQPENATFLFQNAVIRAVLGKPDEALDYLRRAVRFGVTREMVENEPALEPLRSRPEYRRLLGLAG